MKEEIKNLKMERQKRSEAFTRVGLGSGTFAWPPPLSTRWSDAWVPRNIEFKGRNPDFTKRNGQEITDSQVKTVLEDLAKLMPQEVRKVDQLRTHKK